MHKPICFFFSLFLLLFGAGQARRGCTHAQANTDGGEDILAPGYTSALSTVNDAEFVYAE